MSTRISPIETHAYGCRFRSRTEARWAVAFTEARIEWVYELEGYRLPSGPYLPDFWLPQVHMWAEVKGTEFSLQELRKAHDLANATDCPVLLLAGLPAEAAYWAIEPEGADPGGWPERLSDGTEVIVCDYGPFNGDRYHLTEARFYACSGADNFPTPSPDFCGGHPAIDAALSARFEHGETPTGPKR